MKISSKIRKTKVNEVRCGHAFFYEDRFWIRLSANGESFDSVDACVDKTYVADLKNGDIVLLPDKTIVTLVDAECVFSNEVFAGA